MLRQDRPKTQMFTADRFDSNCTVPPRDLTTRPTKTAPGPECNKCPCQEHILFKTCGPNTPICNAITRHNEMSDSRVSTQLIGNRRNNGHEQHDQNLWKLHGCLAQPGQRHQTQQRARTTLPKNCTCKICGNSSLRNTALFRHSPETAHNSGVHLAKQKVFHFIKTARSHEVTDLSPREPCSL